MQPIVTAQVHDVPHPVGRGRYLCPGSQYLYSLLCDPFVLCRTRCLPRLRLAGEDIAQPAEALLLHACPTPLADRDLIRAVSEAGGTAVLNRPDPALLEDVAPSAYRGAAPGTLISLRERWDLGPLAQRTYHYEDRAPFLRLDARGGAVLSTIGGNPDLMVLGQNAAVFAGDPLAALIAYLNTTFQPQLYADFAALLAGLVAELTRSPLLPSEQDVLRSSFELRRDFHAFGFAHLVVGELDRCHGGGRTDTGAAAEAAIDAAGRLVAGDTSAARDALGRAFQLLETQNRRIQPRPAIFTDTLHGGGLFEDLGYFEFDWPQHPADMLASHLGWARQRSYRFNIDFGADCIRFMAQRFPGLFAQLAQAQEEGLVEFVNGTMSQPYPPLYSLESLVRQVERGNAVLAEVLGRPARVYASQEFGFSPQMASVLAQSGYAGVVLRVQNMGDAPTLRDERIIWAAPNGDAIEALPSHPYKSEQENGVTYNNLHLKIFAHGETGLDFAVFSGLGDICYYRLFREELARICHYAPVFGTFSTWSAYFAQLPRVAPRRCTFQLADFGSWYAFMEIEGRWQGNRQGTGHANSSSMRTMATCQLLRATELLETFDDADRQRGTGPDDPAWSWDHLLAYQSHDAYIAPYYKSGSFLGGVLSHRCSTGGRGAQLVADYCGPWDQMLALERAEVDMDATEPAARRALARHLKSLAAATARGGRYGVFNPGPAAARPVRIPRGSGARLALGDRTVPTQDDGPDALAWLDLPACGLAVLHEADAAAPAPPADVPAVTVGADFSLDNGILRAEFDPERGTLTSLVSRRDGRELLTTGSLGLCLPDGDACTCQGARIASAGPLRAALVFDVEVVAGQKQKQKQKRGGRARARVRATLDAGQSLLRYEVHVLRCPSLRGDQWVNYLGVRFQLANPAPQWTRCHGSMLEPVADENVFSRNLLLARSPGDDVLFVNFGNQFYRVRGGAVDNILVFEQEPGRRFAGAVGAALDNPIMQARAFVEDVYVERLPRAAGARASGGAPAVSLLSVDRPDVEILSCRRGRGHLLVRVASTTARPVTARIRVPGPVEAAHLTDLRGDPQEPLETSDGQAIVPLRPWDVRQIALAPMPSVRTPHGSQRKARST